MILQALTDYYRVLEQAGNTPLWRSIWRIFSPAAT